MTANIQESATERNTSPNYEQPYAVAAWVTSDAMAKQDSAKLDRLSIALDLSQEREAVANAKALNLAINLAAYGTMKVQEGDFYAIVDKADSLCTSNPVERVAICYDWLEGQLVVVEDLRDEMLLPEPTVPRHLSLVCIYDVSNALAGLDVSTLSTLSTPEREWHVGQWAAVLLDDVNAGNYPQGTERQAIAIRKDVKKLYA